VDLISGVVVGVEALLRWAHPKLGAIPPADFIPIAEECGVIVPLGAWVIEEALTAHAARRRADPSWREVVMWVNVAPSQLTPELPALVRRIAAARGMPARLLGVEVTEGSLMADLPAGRSVLEELHELGVQVALDDFGTGYSSLAQLKHLPVQVLKIDKSFIDGLGCPRPDTGIVVAVLALARAHGLRVVAEGVETVEQLRVLTALDCDSAQGFYFGLPGALDAVRTRYVVPDRDDRRLRSFRRTGTS
jgi:EAL domain-containing protein (putative c-di-GMP-specific phosphodiesterase class I)